MAESCDPASHTLAGALGLANQPEPRSVNSPWFGGSPRYCPEFSGVKARYFACKVCGPKWCQVMDASHLLTLTRGANHHQFLPGILEPRCGIEPPSPGYRPGHQPAMLTGRGWCQQMDSNHHFLLTKEACGPFSTMPACWPPEVESSHRNAPSEGACRNPAAGRKSGAPGENRTPDCSVRSAASAVHRRGLVGTRRRFRAVPFRHIRPISRAYKAHPLTRAAE